MLSLAFLSLLAPQDAAALRFEAAAPVTVAGQPIDLGLAGAESSFPTATGASPGFLDWDGDGLLDLVLGEGGTGRMAVCPGSSSEGVMSLREAHWIEVDGTSVVRHPV